MHGVHYFPAVLAALAATGLIACAEPELRWYPIGGQHVSRFGADRYECLRDSTAAAGPAPAAPQLIPSAPAAGAGNAFARSFANSQAMAQAGDYAARGDDLFNACMEAHQWELREGP